nr:unnamed protein product [Spirometra erinaceieuropaei]
MNLPPTHLVLQVYMTGDGEGLVPSESAIIAAVDEEAETTEVAGERGSDSAPYSRWRSRRPNQRRLGKITNEGADGRREVNVAVTGRSNREPAIEESQPSTIGEANQRTRRRKTGSACGRYLLAMGELAIEESQPRTVGEANQRRRRRKT